MACYFVVIRSTRLRDGQLRSIKGVFRGPIGARGAPREGKCSGLYCELCDKQYERQQQYDNHTSSYDHHLRQRLKDLKQREFYRQLRSRRRRRGREQWPRSPLQVKHSVSGLGPMFRNTTVALDTADEPTVLTGCTKEQVRSRSQWGSSDLSSLDTAAASIDHIINETARPPEAHRCVNCTVPSAAADDDRNGNTHTPPDPHTPSAHTHTRPVCFSLPKRNCTLLHQSAAVFLQPPTSKENETKTPPNVDRADVETSSDSNKQTDPISATLKPTQNERMDSQRPKEPFCRVLSRDGATLLLWPSEMVSYTHAAPSISFSVNPLLHDFKAENTNKEVSVDKSGEPGRGEGFVIKRAEREQRQEEAQGPGPGPGGGLRSAQRPRGGLGSAHEREHEDSHSAAAIFVAHCVSSSCDESALKCPLDCEFKGHREPRTKRRRGKRRNRKRRTNRAARISKKIRKLQANSVRMNQVNSQELRADLETPNLERPDLRDPKHRRKHQAASNDQKRAHLLSHLPVSHCNGGEQLCAQVNSQARRHLPLQSNSQRSPGFRKTPSGGAACNAAISLVPRADIETPRCPAITPCPASSRVDVCEPPAETQLRENHMLPENGAMRKELLGKRTFDKTFDLNTLRDQVQNVPVEPHTVPVVAPGADDPFPSPPLPQTHVHCDVFTEAPQKRSKKRKTQKTASV
ncbi:hypothetical protein NQD34_011489 [Periophthalmus magnuspinnatus]|nr:hypothetical protein NQD34_011489 [Periophthalmus magnuspinnatus]